MLVIVYGVPAAVWSLSRLSEDVSVLQHHSLPIGTDMS